MFQNNPLLTQLKQQLHDSTPRIKGIVKAHGKGFGFLELDNKKSYFIPAAKMKKLLHGDRIEGTINLQGDKEQFEPETIIESALTHFIGTIDHLDKHLVVYPYNQVIKQAIRAKISKNVTEKLTSGCWVIAKLITRPFQENHQFFLAEVTEFIAAKDDILAPWLTTLSQYGLDRHAPKLIEQLVMPDYEKVQRENLNDLPFFSIDNQDTKDIDDALYVNVNEKGFFELTVAIADPSAYIAKGSTLDTVAKQRLFTTYLTDFNVPMLPAEIADNFCSLKPNVERAAIICRLCIDSDGNISPDPYFSTAWITSKAKLSYSDVSDYLEQQKMHSINNDSICHQLTILAKFAAIRSRWRQKNALLFKDKDDYKFILNDDRHVVDIIKNPRRIANQIVEEAMIAANHTVARSLLQHLGFAIFNSHTGFDTKHVDIILKILHDNNITEFDKKRLTSFDGYSALRKKIANNAYLESRILRYQNPADFTVDAAPHFGLGFNVYLTWTSPLRKYSDLTNHRLLKAMIRKETIIKSDENWLKLITEKRKLQRLAERELTNYLYNQFFADKIGSLFDAEIIDVNKGGAKVRLVDNGAIAFLPLSLIHIKRNEIENNQDEAAIKVNKKTLFRIADIITVSLHEIKNDSRTIIVKYETNQPEQ